MFKSIFRTNRILASAALASIVFALFPVSTVADEGGNVFTDKANNGVWEVLGPNGGDVRSITVDPRDKDKLYISTMDGQIHTSADGGATWRLLATLNRPLLVLDQLMIDRSDSSVLYVSGHRGKLPGGFFKSTDSGATWKEAKELRGEAIHAMTQSEKDEKTLFVGTKAGIWTSADSGDNWAKVESGTMPLDINSMAVDPRNTSTIYAGTTWRPYKSTDSGKSWRLIKTGMIDDSDIFAITIDTRNADHIIASACSGIYESFNGGEKWAKIQGIPSQSRRTRAIVQHPSKPGTIYAGTTEGFWMSSNGGKSWSMNSARNLEVNSIAVHPDAPDRVFLGTNNFGVMVSNDGGKNFVQTNNSFTSRFTYQVTADVAEPNRLYAMTKNTSSSGGFFFTSTDAGKSWVQAKSLDINRDSPFTMLQDRIDPNTIYLGANRGIFKSIDRGVTWKLLEPPPPPKKKPVRKARGKAKPVAVKKPVEPTPPPDGPVVGPALTETVKVLAFTNDDRNGMFAGTDKGLYVTYDIAKGWEKLKLGEGIDENIFVVYTSPLVPGTIWVGTASSGVIVSTDDGKTWTKTNAVPEDVPVSSIATDPKRPNYIYVGTTQAFYLSRDGGRTWNRRGGNLPLGNFTSILINPENTDEIFVSSALENDGGIFHSTDAGMKWKRFDSKEMPLPSRRVWSMVFDPLDHNRIFAGTHSSGVYRIERKVSDEAKTASSKTDAN
jgi:photosystem II stability/assembly factor-like uncharacterized protein